MSRFLSSRFADLAPYTPGEQPQNRKYIKLNTNESPYPPSPKVLEAVNREETEKLRLYSDPEVKPLVKAIAENFGVGENQVLAGNGSDEILAFSFLAFNDRENPVCFPNISYGFYKVFARLYDLPYEAIPLKEDYTIDLSDYIGCGKNIVIANPNAPTGIALSRSELEQILKSNPANLVLIDEAYVDFGAESCASLINRYDNLLVVQTLSKSRSMAGGRLGFALAAPEIIEDLNKMKFSFNPYNVNRLSMAAGTAAMEDRAYFENCVSRIIKTREWTAQELAQMGFTVLPSKANFLFAKPPEGNGAEYFQNLREKGILVRHFADPLISGYVRITIGSEEEMEILCRVTKELMVG